MSNVKLNESAKAVLESFCRINPQMRINDKYLYTKSDESGTIGTYMLKNDEVIIPKEFGIYRTDEFLSIFKLFEKAPEVELNDNTLVISDNKKTFTYQTCPLEMIPKRNTKGVEMFESTTDKLLTVVVDEMTLKEISGIKSKLDLDTLKLKSENDKIKLVASSSVTDNSVEFVLEGSASQNVVLVFSDINIFDSLMSGIYTITVKMLKINDTTSKPFAKLELNGTEETGSLYYFCGLSV